MLAIICEFGNQTDKLIRAKSSSMVIKIPQVQTGAFSTGVGGVLLQKNEPIAYAQLLCANFIASLLGLLGRVGLVRWSCNEEQQAYHSSRHAPTHLGSAT